MPEPWVFEVLPDHPHPAPGECLSSYLIRLAAANGGISVWELVRDLFPEWTAPQQLRLLRWEYPLDDWGRLPLRTSRSSLTLDRLTVVPWLEKFRSLPRVTRHGYGSPAPLLRGIVHPTLQVCPPCLQTAPFVRLLWRLTPVQVCLDHGCLLQGHCHECGMPLTVIGPTQRLVSCTYCDADLRDLPMVAAPEPLMVAQRRRQEDLQFLLDPSATLLTPQARDALGPTLPRAIGRTFRYLRQQTGQSLGTMAQHLVVAVDTIADLERGNRPAAMPLYLAYLDACSLSWRDFAALQVPPAFVCQLQEPSYLALRRCPTPACINHQAPSPRVIVLADHPDRAIVRFRCTACHRTFTRRPDGTLVTKPRRPVLQPGEPPPVVKSAEEIDRLTALGLQGLTNRTIARALGWGEKTVRMYWIALDLEEQVHTAQAHRRREAVIKRRAVLRARVETIVEALCATNEEITLRRVSRMVGNHVDYVATDPDIAAYVRTVAQPHNARVRQQRDATLDARLTTALEEARGRAEPIIMHQIARQLGLTTQRLLTAYPALHQRLRQAAVGDHTARQVAQRAHRLAQINAAAARLVEQDIPLTYTGLLTTAGVDRYYGFHDPLIHELLEQWVGDPMPPDRL